MVWHELRQTGVVRRLRSRDGWARRWDADMALPQTPPPARLTGPQGTWPVAMPTARDLGLALDPCPDRQPGARAAGLQTLHSFLTRRGRDYRFEISSPITAFDSCSHLSPHIAWGTLSLREIAQATTERLRGLSPEAPDARRGRGSLISFAGRQHWHCHFMQKLEDAPRIESGSSSKRHSRYTSGKANRTLVFGKAEV